MMLKKVLNNLILPVLAAVIIAFFINKFVFFLANVPTGSMNPTIIPGEHIFVTRVFQTEKLNRRDIVLFKSAELKEILVKRLIGLPGDRIKITDGKVYINDIKQEEPYVYAPDDKTAFNGNTIVIPEGKYLFLGDNRADSFDSRYWRQPFIEKNNIIGKARFIAFPITQIKSLK